MHPCRTHTPLSQGSPLSFCSIVAQRNYIGYFSVVTLIIKCMYKSQSLFVLKQQYFSTLPLKLTVDMTNHRLGCKRRKYGLMQHHSSKQYQFLEVHPPFYRRQFTISFTVRGVCVQVHQNKPFLLFHLLPAALISSGFVSELLGIPVSQRANVLAKCASSSFVRNTVHLDMGLTPVFSVIYPIPIQIQS